MSVELVASCTVLQSPGHPPQLCLGPVAMSKPPQGGGPDVANWDWSTVSGKQTVAGTTWGEYTVVGTYTDGVFTLTRPPVPVPAQRMEEAPDVVPWEVGPPPTPSGYSDAELERIARTIHDMPEALIVGPANGYVELVVGYDDGTLQRELDERYGVGAVHVYSVMQPYQSD